EDRQARHHGTHRKVTMPAPPPPKAPPMQQWQAASSGLVLGALTAIGLLQLIGQAIPILGTDWLLPVGATVGALLGRTRARRALWTTAAAVIAALAIVGYTSLASVLIQAVIRSDPLQPAPAVVVLAS